MNKTELVHPVEGIRLAAAYAGIKNGVDESSAEGLLDVVLIEICEGASVAAVYTRNVFCAAPVLVAREHIESVTPRYLLINSGNANAGTGTAGLADAVACCEAVADAGTCSRREVLPFSTGVIGEPLPASRITSVIPDLLSQLDQSAWAEAAQGIMTTDTYSKISSQQFELDGERVTVTGIAKGSGMIRPDMATMLAYVATDAAVDEDVLQACLRDAMAASFNCITVDGDTSTNDACVLMATGRAHAAKITSTQGDTYHKLLIVVRAVCESLAQSIIHDGEGATKFITIEVVGGQDESECREVAYTVAQSPLVKTAFFASDPNWGRILAAVGCADIENLDVTGVSINLGDVCIVRAGERAADYTEELGQAVMQRNEIVVQISLGRGDAAAHVWTCDLSYDYVKINAEYRT